MLFHAVEAHFIATGVSWRSLPWYDYLHAGSIDKEKKERKKKKEKRKKKKVVK